LAARHTEMRGRMPLVFAPRRGEAVENPLIDGGFNTSYTFRLGGPFGPPSLFSTGSRAAGPWFRRSFTQGHRHGGPEDPDSAEGLRSSPDRSLGFRDR